MKLYTKPGACSTACHISLHWSGAAFGVQVLTAEEMKAPAYLAINPAGAVPALEDGDFVLTQNAAIVGYIADLNPAAGLAGDGSPRQRAEANRWLAFCNADVHPAFHPLFGPARFIGDESQFDALKAAARLRLRGLYERAERELEGREWIAGFRSYADPYLYITLGWASKTGVDLSGFDNLVAFVQRMEADAGVQAALKAEGLA
ncbi:glutathione S-transferase GST-4.5 [Lysobacter xinjiangensis]|uniref:Glutathione S-transferase GST-4.5 n=1 Tax=Cognatilysobacter xinjiangensis TaxID=546892 RepID=A0ABQ3C8H9_9GAMM|nr:glutathione S-transferase N-terminal domain-containing protein [Lysobacter xinjiangensis]GGZ72759.1 glutathione S-transferase GST-4.5 [Lysobacter xinjiangensis]